MVTLDDVRKAAAAIRDGIVETPCIPSRVLSERVGAEVWLKFENLQFTGAFKERGALNKLLALSGAQRGAGVLAVSAGNHAQAVACHAQRLGIRAVIVMPRFTPFIKIERTRAFGPEIVLTGETFDEARQAGLALAAARGLTIVHPYDDPLVIAGQGTVGLEMLAQAPGLDALVVPVGGGGLIAGIATAVKALAPHVDVYGVETAAFPAVHCALHGTEPVFGSSSIADGIAVKAPGTLTLEIIRRLCADVLLVDDGEIEQALVQLLEIEKTVVEGAGAPGLAALVRHPDRFRGKRVGVVLSGGNIDPRMLSDIIDRALVRSHRLVQLRVEMRDLPGALAQATAILAAANANIEEVHHQRAFTDLPVLSADVEFVLQTRGEAHVNEIIAALAEKGFAAEVVAD